MTPYEIFFILFFFALVIVGMIVLYKSYEYNKKLTSQTLTRGMNGSQGKTVNMTCPAGQKIRVFKAHYVCTNGTFYEDSSCDPYWSPNGQLTNFFNPSNTLDVTEQIGQKCNGGETCEFTIPSGANIGICGQKNPGTLNGSPCNGILQLIGTYDCVPN